MKAVIFDMDGLMVDTEPLHLQAWNMVLDKYGVCLTAEEWDRHIGGTAELAAKRLKNHYHLPATKYELIEEKIQNLLELLKTVRPKQGLYDLLEKLKPDMKTAVASQSRQSTVKHVLKYLNIKSFDYVATRDDDLKPKPAPDIFQSTAQHLGVAPMDCLVLEDSETGVMAAKSAGMKCYAIPSEQTKNQKFLKADRILGSLNEVYQCMIDDGLVTQFG